MTPAIRICCYKDYIIYTKIKSVMFGKLPEDLWVSIGHTLPNTSLRRLCCAIPRARLLRSLLRERWRVHLAGHLRRTRCITHHYPIQKFVKKCIVADCACKRAFMVDVTIEGETLLLLREGPYCWKHRPADWN